MTSWICKCQNSSDLDVNQMEVSILNVLTHFLVSRQYQNKAVLRSGRPKEGRPSLLDETILTKHTQGPKGPGTTNQQQRPNTHLRRQPFMYLHALHVKTPTCDAICLLKFQINLVEVRVILHNANMVE